MRDELLPPGFHDGVIIFLPKPGDAADPANFRPITLLNTDYRVFARVLARRLGQALDPVIDRQQTAFLPGRSIGENIMLLQLLPHALRAQHRSALAVFCDFRKAYDTVDRPFLLQVMGRLGVGGAFLRATAAVLSNTYARAYVNGALSRPVAFHAGVRQGCPLAPLLYLFLGQALGRFLAAVGVGVAVGHDWLACSQYADDVTAFLPDEAALPHFLQAMDAFGAATGQRLNPAKSSAMLLGARTLGPAPPPAPLPLVRSASALGVTFHEGVGAPSIDWTAKVATVKSRLCTLASLPLSALGRGLGCAAYGVSRLLFHAEFGGLPPAQTLQDLTAVVAALVDSGIAPGGQVGPRFAGVAADLLVGSPKEGGFGVLPLAEHIRARHAVWGARLVCALAEPDPPPWAVAARGALSPFLHASHPLALLAWRPSRAERAGIAPPLLRVLDGLAALPPVEDVSGTPLEAGPWCTTAPVWHNPLLPAQPEAALATEFADLAESGITTVAGLAAAAVAVTVASNRDEYLAAQAVHLPRNSFAFLDRHRTRQQLHLCVARLPQPWLAAAQRHAPAPAAAFVGLALPRLGWPFAAGPVTVEALTVRAATWAQLGNVVERRQQRHAAFVAEVHAAGGSAAPAEAEAQAEGLARLLGRLWRLPWDNARKEVFWRLALDALPTAARRHAADACCCGAPGPGRMHHFWACPVAEALRNVLASCLQRRGMLPSPLQPQHILLAQPPSRLLHGGVWRVVCLAAVCALDHVRRATAARALVGVTASGPPEAARMAERAVARFWDLLTDFCVLDMAPKAWQRSVRDRQPFMAWEVSWKVVRTAP